MRNWLFITFKCSIYILKSYIVVINKKFFKNLYLSIQGQASMKNQRLGQGQGQGQSLGLSQDHKI